MGSSIHSLGELTGGSLIIHVLSSHACVMKVTLATATGFYHRGDDYPVDKIEIFVMSYATNHDSNMTARLCKARSCPNPNITL